MHEPHLHLHPQHHHHHLTNINDNNNTTSTTTNTYHDSHGPSSPVAPAYSPITPKVQPVLPAAVVSPHESGGHDFDFASVASHQQTPLTDAQLPLPTASPIPSADYIPQPPSLPFSTDDVGDAIALRAAISTLQFQKQKAQDDIKALASIRQLALDAPETFKDELAAGRLREQKPSLGNLGAILDNIEDGDSDDEVVLDASREEQEDSLPAKISESQTLRLAAQDVKAEPEDSTQKHFPRIPGPQTIVRMPHVNWAKYGIAGEPLDSLHEQQRRWPGTLGKGDQGREYTIAAPYSPFMDSLDQQHQQHQQQQVNDTDGPRKDSGPAPLTGTISEQHVMETRSRT